MAQPDRDTENGEQDYDGMSELEIRQDDRYMFLSVHGVYSRVVVVWIAWHIHGYSSGFAFNNLFKTSYTANASTTDAKPKAGIKRTNTDKSLLVVRPW